MGPRRSERAAGVHGALWSLRGWRRGAGIAAGRTAGAPGPAWRSGASAEPRAGTGAAPAADTEEQQGGMGTKLLPSGSV